MVSTAVSLPIPEAPDPKRYVAEVTRASGSSFFLPMLLLPREKREAMLALYAFCRETDDVADEIEDPAQSRALIEAWRGEVQALYQGAPRHPVTRALAAPVERFGLAERHFMEILEGFEMDGGGAMLRPTLAELERYCHCVAGCVGLLSVEIFGYRARTIPTFARHLGQAFQLTNILRDVAEDAKRGRIYLPQELLERHGLADIGPEAIGRTPGVEKVCGALGGMARRRFGAASEALPRSERRSMRPAILMRSVYEAYLDRIERAGFPVAGRRIRFTATQKWADAADDLAPTHGRIAADDLAPTSRLVHFPQWRALAYSNPSTAGAHSVRLPTRHSAWRAVARCGPTARPTLWSTPCWLPALRAVARCGPATREGWEPFGACRWRRSNPITAAPDETGWRQAAA